MGWMDGQRSYLSYFNNVVGMVRGHGGGSLLCTHSFLGSKKIQKLLLWFRNGLGMVMSYILVSPPKT